jgi:hypothetical protein
MESEGGPWNVRAVVVYDSKTGVPFGPMTCAREPK